MRHFLFEFITGGGLTGQPLSETLVGEGEIMVRTLLNELTDINNAAVCLTRDSRLGKFEDEAKQYIIEKDIEEKLPEFLKESDVSWLIAPETENYLTKYAELFIKYGKIFVGSSPEAIKTTSSKYLTNKILAEAGINVVDTQPLIKGIPKSKTGWIVKPDDGVGGESTYLIDDKKSLYELMNKEEAKNIIVQPYIKGKHMSMSLLVLNGDVQLLACNKQYIDINNDRIKLLAIGVNECLSFKNEMFELAKKVVSAIPGLAGYIGVDLLGVDNELSVLEINPRFTTAYAGISESIGCNVAAKILDTFLNKKLPNIDLGSAIPVRINV
jgi:tyramine---L-glutamate ligase